MKYNAAKNSADGYNVAIAAIRKQKIASGEILPYVRKEVIGDCTLYLGDCLEVMPTLESVNHVITDPPYESSLHASKNSLRGPVRVDSGPDLKDLNFEPIDKIRNSIVKIVSEVCDGWFIAFCTIEGVSKWADEINPSPIKYKRACVWIKPDCTPQLNGQGPAQGCECFVVGWNGAGHAKWNSGGKRGVYRHNVNNPDRHGVHPTEKPWRLFVELLSDFTNDAQVILDPFMGSGTTGVSCVKLGRKFIGIELDPDYFQIACDRIRKAYDQPDMFVESPKPEPQEHVSDFFGARDNP